jgi:hypothetical protein
MGVSAPALFVAGFWAGVEISVLVGGGVAGPLDALRPAFAFDDRPGVGRQLRSFPTCIVVTIDCVLFGCLKSKLSFFFFFFFF